MFWYGLIVGVFIGANLGLLVFGLLNMAAGLPAEGRFGPQAGRR